MNIEELLARSNQVLLNGDGFTVVDRNPETRIVILEDGNQFVIEVPYDDFDLTRDQFFELTRIIP